MHVLLQILRLKYQIEEEIQKNNKLKKQLTSLQEDIERTVSIVIQLLCKVTANVCST